MIPVANHLWQSTLFAAAAGLLTLLLRANRAHVRYCVWLAASVKFLVPFSILVAAGSVIGDLTSAALGPAQVVPTAAGLSSVIEHAGAPFTTSVSPWAAIETAQRSSFFTDAISTALVTIWAIGFLTLVCRWTLRWRRMRASVRNALSIDVPAGLPVKSSPAFGEPGVFGIFRPVLLLPEGIADSLTVEEMKAIVEHELCHVRRRDNLASAIHMVVEALFWFHPLVWWLGARLMEERERACDEAVLRSGVGPRAYAEGILKICELYLTSPLACVAGVTGGDLKRRIEAIMSERAALNLDYVRKAALAVAGLAALAGPVTVGILQVSAVRAHPPQLAAPSAAPGGPQFDVASIKPIRGGSSRPLNSIDLNFLMGVRHSRKGQFDMPFTTIGLLIQLAYNIQDFRVLGGPPWINTERYEIKARTDGNATFEQMQPMLRSLLADRCKLTLRREMREIPVYELTVAKGGLKIKAAKEGSCVTFDASNPPPALPPPSPNRPPPPLDACGGVRRQIVNAAPERRDHIDGVGVPMSKLIEYISEDVRRVVVDSTGFTEKFDFHLEFSPSEVVDWLPSSVTPPSSGLGPAPSIFASLQQQLGLRLESSKRLVEVLVIDRVERPSEN